MRNTHFKILLTFLLLLSLGEIKGNFKEEFKVVCINPTICPNDSLILKVYISEKVKTYEVDLYRVLGSNEFLYGLEIGWTKLTKDTLTIKIPYSSLKRGSGNENLKLWFVSNFSLTNINNRITIYDTIPVQLISPEPLKVLFKQNKKYIIGDTIEFGLNVAYDTLRSRFFADDVSTKRPKDKNGKDIHNKLIFQSLGTKEIKFVGTHSTGDCGNNTITNLKFDIVEDIKFDIYHQSIQCGYKDSLLNWTNSFFATIKRNNGVSAFKYIESIDALAISIYGFAGRFHYILKEDSLNFLYDTILVEDKSSQHTRWGILPEIHIKFKNTNMNDTILKFLTKFNKYNSNNIYSFYFNPKRNKLVCKFKELDDLEFYNLKLIILSEDTNLHMTTFSKDSVIIQYKDASYIRTFHLLSFVYKLREGCFDARTETLSLSSLIYYYNYKLDRKLFCYKSTFDYTLLYFDSLKYDIKLKYPSGRVLSSGSNSLMLDFSESGKYILQSKVIDTVNNKTHLWYDTINIESPNIKTNNIAPTAYFTQCDDQISIRFPNEVFEDSSYSSKFSLELYDDSNKLIESINSFTFTPIGSLYRMNTINRKSPKLNLIKLHKTNFDKSQNRCIINDTTYLIEQQVRKLFDSTASLSLSSICFSNKCSIRAIIPARYNELINIKWFVNGVPISTSQLSGLNNEILEVNRDSTRLVNCYYEVYGNKEKYGSPCSISPNKSIYLEALSVENDNTLNILFPNPISEIISINEIGSFEIYSITGEIISKGENTTGNINVENITTGIYFLKINNKTYKFVKK